MEMIYLSEDQVKLVHKLTNMIANVTQAHVAVIMENDAGETSILKSKFFSDQRLHKIVDGLTSTLVIAILNDDGITYPSTP